jgi:hypothetical protein
MAPELPTRSPNRCPRRGRPATRPGYGVCSSAVPYVTDQPAMARLHRATFALMC